MKKIMLAIIAIGLVLTATNWSFAEVWLEDSFEGTPPKGWAVPPWFEYGETSHHCTTNEIAPPEGSYCYRQSWLTSGESGALNLPFSYVAAIPDQLGAGTDFYLSYYLRYDAAFDWSSDTTGLKHIILQSNSETDDRAYIGLFYNNTGAKVRVAFQLVAGYYSNVNGEQYRMPKGEWVKFDWYIKVSPITQNQGILKGWVNGVLRWDYSNIATIKAGGYDHLYIDRTWDNATYGPNQKRYWDLISISSGSQCKPGNVNDDGNVNVLDLIRVAKDFGKTSGYDPNCDTNNDGKVDIRDLIYVARHFGE